MDEGGERILNHTRRNGCGFFAFDVARMRGLHAEACSTKFHGLGFEFDDQPFRQFRADTADDGERFLILRGDGGEDLFRREGAEDGHRHFHADALHGGEGAEPDALGGAGEPVEVDMILAHMRFGKERDRATFFRHGRKCFAAAEDEIADATHIKDQVILGDFINASGEFSDHALVLARFALRHKRCARLVCRLHKPRFQIRQSDITATTGANMNVNPDEGFLGIAEHHPWSQHFMVLAYSDQSISLIPRGAFRNWMDEESQYGNFSIGRCSALGVGSIIKYDEYEQHLKIGRYVAGGMRLRFVLNGQHETNSISMTMFGALAENMQNPPPPQYGPTVLKNDIWIGDEAMFLGGSTIENGCVIGARALIPPNFKSEPYGIYAGTPARLVRFRFSEKLREALLDLAWWEMPMDWVRKNNAAFLQDLNADEGKALETVAELRRLRAA